MSSDASNPSDLHARGANHNPPNRFDSVYRDPNSEIDICPDDEPRRDLTTYLRDHAKTIITYNDSPDVGFDAGINVYRGCEHGCIYCYARPTHEFLGFSSGLDFESKILIKEEAPRLLRQELMSKTWNPQVLAMSGITDPYQPIERKKQLTRQCLKVLADFRNPVVIITKNQLITRDIDLLQELNQFSAVAVFISLTTLDTNVRKRMEPRTAPPEARLRTIEMLAKKGIPVGTLLAPIVPGLTDHEIPNLLAKAADAGAGFAGHVILRLPYQVKDLFDAWLGQHFPEKREKVINRLKAIRSGSLNSKEFGNRMKGEGIFADQIHQLFKISCRKAGILHHHPQLTTANFRSNPSQLDLFAR